MQTVTTIGLDFVPGDPLGRRPLGIGNILHGRTPRLQRKTSLPWMPSAEILSVIGETASILGFWPATAMTRMTLSGHLPSIINLRMSAPLTAPPVSAQQTAPANVVLPMRNSLILIKSCHAAM